MLGGSFFMGPPCMGPPLGSPKATVNIEDVRAILRVGHTDLKGIMIWLLCLSFFRVHVVWA